MISTHRFDAKAEKLLTVDERADLEFSLAKAPEAHPLNTWFERCSEGALGEAGDGQARRRSRDLLLRHQRRGSCAARNVRQKRKRGLNR